MLASLFINAEVDLWTLKTETLKIKKLAREHLYIEQSKQTRWEMDLSSLHAVYEAIFYPM